jgi:alpha-tubulin suppressor-like RCC1 family protein
VQPARMWELTSAALGRRRTGVLTHGGFWLGVALWGIALGGCAKSSVGPAQPTAAKVVFTVQPSNAAAGAMNTPAVQVAVEDAQGNTVTTANTSITVAIGTNPASGTLAGTKTVAAVNGVATFSTLSLNLAGTGYTLTASATDLTGATSSAFNISAGSATKLIFIVQPSNVVAGAAITPGVQVALQDAQGNTVTTATTSITVAIGTNPASGTLAGTKTIAAVNGVARFSTLSLNTAGTGYTLTASATGLTGATSNAFNVVAPVSAIVALVSAGSDYTCGVTTGGAAYCWGYNGFGQLGDGTGTDRLTPVAVFGGLTFAAVSAGDYHTCGLTTSGAAYCWGRNDAGQLGNGTPNGSLTPVAVFGGLTFAAVSAGVYHTCGVTTSGAAYCWGDNFFGALGNGTTTNSATPVAVSGGLTFAAISAGDYHTCGVTPSGAAYCWGDNPYGALGNGTTSGPPQCVVTGTSYPCSTTPVAVSGGLTFATVSAGSFYTCGVTPSGAAYCWGANGLGWLGNGTTTNSATPVAVSGGLTFAAVSARYYQACGVTTDGAAYCWGSNLYGGLGNGTNVGPQLCSGVACSTTPVAVAGGLTFAAVSVGTYSNFYQESHTCGVTPGGAAYCWGFNRYGQLGDGTSGTDRLTPVAVSGGLTFAATARPPTASLRLPSRAGSPF